MSEIPYYKDYMPNAIRGLIAGACCFAVFVFLGLVHKFRWKKPKETEAVVMDTYTVIDTDKVAENTGVLNKENVVDTNEIENDEDTNEIADVEKIVEVNGIVDAAKIIEVNDMVDAEDVMKANEAAEVENVLEDEERNEVVESEEDMDTEIVLKSETGETIGSIETIEQGEMEDVDINVVDTDETVEMSGKDNEAFEGA